MVLAVSLFTSLFFPSPGKKVNVKRLLEDIPVLVLAGEDDKTAVPALPPVSIESKQAAPSALPPVIESNRISS